MTVVHIRDTNKDDHYVNLDHIVEVVNVELLKQSDDNVYEWVGSGRRRTEVRLTNGNTIYTDMTAPYLAGQMA